MCLQLDSLYTGWAGQHRGLPAVLTNGAHTAPSNDPGQQPLLPQRLHHPLQRALRCQVCGRAAFKMISRILHGLQWPEGI